MADDRLHDRACARACGRCADRKRGANAQGLRRSRGGLSTKIHAATDALGNPVRLLLGLGQRNDITQVHELIEGFEPQAVIADKAYDADHLREAVLANEAEP
jgi:putative transposase